MKALAFFGGWLVAGAVFAFAFGRYVRRRSRPRIEPTQIRGTPDDYCGWSVRAESDAQAARELIQLAGRSR